MDTRKKHLWLAAALLSLLAMSCPSTTIGHYPAFFDDFDYKDATISGKIPTIDDSKDLFGPNSWITGPLPGNVVQSRMWSRRQWGDPDFGEHTDITFDASGWATMTIMMLAGHGTKMVDGKCVIDPDGECVPDPDGKCTCVPADPTCKCVTDREPLIVTGFTFPNNGAGTYHARVKFSSLEKGQKIQQAFWVKSPDNYILLDENGRPYQHKGADDKPVDTQYWSEMDFEWNNWFVNDPKTNEPDWTERMHVTNHASHIVKAKTKILECIYYDASAGQVHIDDCIGKYKKIPVVSGQWYNLMMVIDSLSQTVSYSMKSDGWNDDKATVWGGDNVWSQSATIDSNYPTQDLSVFFSQHHRPPNGAITTPPLGQDHPMEIDWFYYTPNTTLKDEDVVAEVASFRALNLARVNTVDVSFVDSSANSSHEVDIKGPDKVPLGGQGFWQVLPTVIWTRYDITLRYRMVKCGKAPEDWVYSKTPSFYYTNDEGYDVLLVEAKARNYWRVPKGEKRYPVTTSSLFSASASKTVALGNSCPK